MHNPLKISVKCALFDRNRKEIMAKRRRYYIVLGDKTTHGGTVITAKGQGRATINEIPIACVGDLTTCPLCKGTHPILHENVYPPSTLDDVQEALEGFYTACGAQLIPSQTLRWHECEEDVHPLVASLEADRAAAQVPEDSGGFVKVGLFGASTPKPPRMSTKAFEANMCEWACDCQNNRPPDLPPLGTGARGTHQYCVNQKIKSNPNYYHSHGHPRDDSPVWAEVSYRKYNSDHGVGGAFGTIKWDQEQYDLVESRSYPGKPTSASIVDDSWRLDVVKIGSNGKPEKFYDMKFPTDNTSFKGEEAREKAYQAIAKKHTGSEDNYVTFVVAERCACEKKQEEKQTQQAPKESWFERFNRKPEKPLDFPPDPGGGTKPPNTPGGAPVPIPLPGGGVIFI